jgi:hypothetical protein
MASYFKRLLTPRATLFAVSIVLLTYVAYEEREVEKIVGCWDCGWETRQAFYLVLGVAGLLVARWWALLISLLLGLKVLYTIGHITLWNNFAEVHGVWRILKSSLRWSSDGHLEFFVELVMAVIVVCYAVQLLRLYVSNRTASNNSLDASGGSVFRN